MPGVVPSLLQIPSWHAEGQLILYLYLI